MTSDKKDLGNRGEKIAYNFLRREGFRILENNYQKLIGEIDIIAERKKCIHFVEVKARTIESCEKYGLPQDAVTHNKQKKIIKTALFYLLENKYSDDANWQIDVIAIIIDEKRGKAKITFIENAVENKRY
ncbi:MAG: YraN family protein [Minisyncoccia bacterium]